MLFRSTLAARAATGFVFEAHEPSALLEAVQRAVAAYRDHALWALVMRTGMRQDVSWGRSARAYVQVYEQALADARPGRPLALV